MNETTQPAGTGPVERPVRQHTPGPWEAPCEPNGRGMGWRAGPAWLGMDSWSDETAANALLVSAAPDLLASLREVLRYADAPDEGCFSAAALARARAAVARAVGAA